MHIYFSGIGGTGIGPLALVARQAGYQVSGSDQQHSGYISYLQNQGIDTIHIGQSYEQIATVHAENPIDWFVYTSALPMENPDAPELQFCRDNSIRISKRDELLNQILQDKTLKLIAVAGTHGKTTTTAMTIWLMQQLGMPLSYILPAKTSFAEMGHFDQDSEYFVYECDEYDRNFLAFEPYLSLITGIDWDHPDIFPTRDEYNQAFQQFVSQSAATYIWDSDASVAGIQGSPRVTILPANDSSSSTLPGAVNRQNAALVAQGILAITDYQETSPLFAALNQFPGVSRRFEQLAAGLYTDYAHTPPKIRGALQLGHEVAGQNLVVVYEGLHNTRQHFIQEELLHLFDDIKQLYIVPSYLAREDTSLKLWSPSDLKQLLSPEIQQRTTPATLDQSLQQAITAHLSAGDTVLCLSAGGGGSLDEWLRKTFA